MDIQKFSLTKKKSHKLWKEYVEACKDNPEDGYLQDMKKIYNQIKSGRKIIDIYTVFQRAGLKRGKFQPKLAICLADAKICYCQYTNNGNLLFSGENPGGWHRTVKSDTIIRDMPEIPSKHPTLKSPNNEWYDNKIIMKTLVPAIPASCRPPKNDLKNYYILWEVDKWDLVPPTDPYLLRRITKNMYVIVAGWNLTDLEKAVIKGRVYNY